MALTALFSDIIGELAGPDSWAGKIIWQCPEAEAVGQAYALQGTIMPGSGGAYPPKCARTRIHHNAEPGRAWITAYYKNSRQPGKARLIGGISSRPKRAVRDLGGGIVEGPDPDGTHWWQITKGSNIIADGVEKIILKTATEGPPDFLSTRALRGRINSFALPNFGNAPPESLLFWTMAYNYEFGSALWYEDYHFLVCPESDDSGTVLSWNQYAEKTKGLWAAIERQVYTPDPALPSDQWAASGEVVKMRQFLPQTKLDAGGNLQRADDPVVVPLFKPGDFSVLDAMVEW